ncbi:MAG: NAD(P)-dependent dehydrogenase (short-subunit alcohol dehydrogenase family) [Paracrocinitomix sp.]|jgi:NAD(P)-dependent dehydrogenase (short-subunit alcohol dehydrogenase family)
MQDFNDKTAVITGGASGIGLAMAHRLGQEGANVVIGDVEAQALDRAADQLTNAGIDVEPVLTDVTDRTQIVALADAAQERFGDIHFLHNNAGVTTAGLAEEQSDAQWDWVLEVNLLAVIYGCREFLPRMKAHGEPAHILNTASMAGMSGGPFMAPYFATKFGVVGLSEGLWHEGQATESNVGISVLCPAFVRTGIARSDRNQPDGMGGWVTAGSQGGARFGEFLATGVNDGIEPADLADTVLSAVRENKLWILTHPQSPEAILRRANAIADTGVPPEVRSMGR